MTAERQMMTCARSMRWMGLLLLAGTVAGCSQSLPKAATSGQKPVTRQALSASVTAYRDSNFGGVSQAFGAGTYRADQGGLATVGNDAIRSLKVPAGVQVLACGSEGDAAKGGWCKTFKAGAYPSLGEFDKQISFLQVSTDSTALYRSQDVYKIVNRNSGKVLDVLGFSKANGASVVQWDDAGGKNQQWSLEQQSDGYYKITNLNSGKVLDVWGVAQNNGAAIKQYDWNGGDNQRFKIEDVGDGFVKFTAKHSGLSFDIEGMAKNNGAALQQWSYGAGTHQQFQLVQVGTGNTPAPTPAPASAPTPASTPAAAPVPAPSPVGGPPAGTGSWKQTYNNDFSGALDPTQDSTQWPCGYGQTCEFNGRYESLYVPENISTQDGQLTIVTKRETRTNWNGKVYPYTSGVFNTSKSLVQQYGYFEVRMKPCATDGNDPDFWLLSLRSWPPEIDIAEFGGGQGGKVVGLNLHAGDNDSQVSAGGISAKDFGVSNFNDDYHVYGLRWEADRLEWYIDGKLVRSYTGNAVPQEPMYVILSDENRLPDDGSWFGDGAKGSYPCVTKFDDLKVWSH